MKIFVTGATGLIGAHTTLELLRGGHDVRLLVRNKQAAHDYFLQHGYDVSDFVVANMLEKDKVKAGMAGCDAIIHMAAIVDLNSKNAKITQSTNLQSIDAVIGSACELGIKKIIYVSSMSVFYDFHHTSLSEDTPLADVKDAYSLSKKLCEIRIRELQQQGQPIITTYPSAVFGPNDPKLAESNNAIIRMVKTVMPITTSGMQFVDARDVAIAHRLLLEGTLAEDKTRERYIVGGHFANWPQFADLLETGAGKKLRRVPVPGAIFRFLGWVYDALRQVMTIDFPISKEGMTIVTRLPPCESNKLIEKTGMHFRPAQQTLSETIAWMREANKI